MKRYITFIFAAACVLAGCARQLDAPVITDEVIFRTKGLDASFVVDTKATAVTDENLTAFYASATQGTAGSETSVWNSAAFASDGESTPTYSGDKWWPLTDPEYHFYASNVALTFDTEGTAVAATTATDVVCAYLPDPTYKVKNDLVFDHVFARVGGVTISADTGYTISDVSISITPKVSGTYNLRTGAGQTDGTGWSDEVEGSATGIAASSPGTQSNDLYLIPGTYTLTAAWTATRGDYTESFSGVEVDVDLVAGKVNNISGTLTGNATEIRFGVSLTAWADNAVDVGTFPLANFPKPIGEFTINASGDKVGFAPGNLYAHISAGPDANAIYTADEWGFHANQWDWCNQTLAVGNTVDHFGWVGASASYDSYGLTTEEDSNAIYGKSATDALKTDWGSIPGVVSALGSGWFTLSTDEWAYVFETRASGALVNSAANARFTLATIRTDATGVNGIILFPDGYAGGTPAGVSWGNINDEESEWSTTCTAAGWDALVAAGCVFLPAAGYRNGGGVINVGSSGHYWSSSPYSVDDARYVYFNSGYVNPQEFCNRMYGFSVRLVKLV